MPCSPFTAGTIVSAPVLSRRKLLQVGGAGLFGLTLPKVFAAEEAARAIKPRAKSVIFLLLYGGPSQLETFDMKARCAEHAARPVSNRSLAVRRTCASRTFA